jgi:hypothetical protein
MHIGLYIEGFKYNRHHMLCLQLVLLNSVCCLRTGCGEEYLDRKWLKYREVHNVYTSSSIVRMVKSRRMRLIGHVASMREPRNAQRILMGKSEGNNPLGRSRRKWEDNIKMDLRETGTAGRD